MEIKKIGETLELATERHLRVSINGMVFNIACTPINVEELIIGFIVTEGIGKFEDVNKSVNVHISDNLIEVDLPNVSELTLTSSGSISVSNEKVGRVKAGEKFRIEELQTSLQYLETEEYKRTRGYHIAAVVSKKGLEARAYDIGRHNAVDKAVGMCVKKGIALNKTFLLLSGRISKGIAMKCVRAGIPLIVSKAAILDSAIELCKQTGLSAVSFATNIAVMGDALEV